MKQKSLAHSSKFVYICFDKKLTEFDWIEQILVKKALNINL
jgi:hypothetical protein